MRGGLHRLVRDAGVDAHDKEALQQMGVFGRKVGLGFSQTMYGRYCPIAVADAPLGD